MGWWFGRILTFEAFADDALCVGDVISDVSAGIADSSDDRSLVGFAAYGQHIKAAIEPLVDAFAVELLDDGARLASVDATILSIADRELGNSSDDRTAPRIQREQLPARTLPSVLRLGYCDEALDYQTGEARATSGEGQRVEMQRELPAVISASDAKSIAQHIVAREWSERDRLTLRLPPRYLGLAPGARVELNLSPRLWRVEQCTIDGFVNVAELRPVPVRAAALAAESGRVLGEKDIPAADVGLVLFDIPDIFQQGFVGSTLMLAASAPSPGWKSRSVEIVAGSLRFAMRTARRKTVLGFASTVLGPADPYLIEGEGALEIRLIDEDQWLLSCDEEAVAGGSNLAVLGSEVLQFGGAQALGEGRWRLTRLLRGRAGTDWATGLHKVGEPFALIERDTLVAVELASWSGSTVTASVRNPSGIVSVSVSAPASTGGDSVHPTSRQPRE